MATPRAVARRTQADRRARSRAALLEATARGISHAGYANLVLKEVAAQAGYTRGALYHQFAGKQELALAVVEWVDQTWHAEVGHLLSGTRDPLELLVAVARGHAVYCRRDVARVMLALRIELSDKDNPVGAAVRDIVIRLTTQLTALITAGRKDGTIPPGPPPRVLAPALLTALEGLVIGAGGKAPHDELMAERLVRGLLALPPA
jgi:AcrR family transcriptional regulator